MDPIEAIDLCRQAAHKGAPWDIPIPRLFNVGDFQQLWLRDAASVRRIMDDLLCAPRVEEGLELLLRLNVFYALFPEVSNLKGMGDADGLHKDVWRHTCAVVAGVPPQLELRWGALLHDIGKFRTRRVLDNGKVTFHNHDRVGARMVDALQARTRLFQDDVALLRTVRHLVLHHLRPASYKDTWTDSAVRRLVTECGDPRFFERLMALSRADLTTKVPARRDRALRRAAELEERVRLVTAADNAPKLPKGTMGLVLDRLALKPGPWLAKLKDELEARMARGELPVGAPAEFYAGEGMKLVDPSTGEKHPGA